MLAPIMVVAACAIAAYCDIRWRRIPNQLTIALAVCGLAFNAASGPKSLLLCAAVMMGVFAAGSVAFSAGMLGGGDVKLLAAGSALLNYPDFLQFILYTVFAGGILALVTAGVHGRLKQTLANVFGLLRPMLYRGSIAPAVRSHLSLPYAVAISAGSLIFMLSKSVLPSLRIPL